MSETVHGIQPLKLDGAFYTPKFLKRRGCWVLYYYLRANRQPLGSSDDHAAVQRRYDILMDKVPDAAKRRSKAGSVAALVDTFQKSDAYPTKPKSRTQYGWHESAICDLWGELPVASLTKAAIEAMQKAEIDAGKGWTGYLRLHHLRTLLNWALRDVDARGKSVWGIDGNMALLVKPVPPPLRHKLFEDEDEAKLVHYLRQNDPMIYVAYMLGAYTAQRPIDLFGLTTASFVESTEFIAGHRVKPTWINVRQQKTGKLVWVPVLPELRCVLQEHVIRARGESAPLILSNRFGEPFQESAFNNRFVTALRAVGLNWKVEGHRGANQGGLQFRDLRRTAMVRMSRAGCTPQEIAAVSGHSISVTMRIIERYIPVDRHMALAGMQKYALWAAERRQQPEPAGPGSDVRALTFRVLKEPRAA